MAREPRLAHVRYYFLGRLERPFAVLSAPNLREWLDAHREGRLVVHYRESGKASVAAEYAQRYRGHNVAILSVVLASSLISPEARLENIDF